MNRQRPAGLTARPGTCARRFRRLGCAAVAAATAAGCISGRVLEGYPGYPFLQFDAPLPADSAFFAIQRAVTAEGFELDFTDLASGAVNTRPTERLGGDVFLTIVVGAVADSTRYVPSRLSSKVWIAGYVRERGGAERIDPLAEDAWSDLEDIAARLSLRLGGTTPRGPEAPPD